jgi:hypothetical protein
MFSAYLEPFADCELLQHRLLAVLHALPEPVIRDFVDDHRFRVAMDEIVPGKGRTVQLASPGPVGNSSRCVVLKRRLADRSEAFACYVIAHEFAHAYLRNGGWGDITDTEDAADALAASWGFRRPAENIVAASSLNHCP